MSGAALTKHRQTAAPTPRTGFVRRLLLLVFAALLLVLLGAALWLYQPDRDRAALEAAYAPPPSSFVDAAGIRLHLRDTGPRDAPPILMLHGFGASLHTWDDWAGLLEAEFRVLRIDLPGFGLTGRDPTHDYGPARTDAILNALLDTLGVARAHLLGSSMGGGIAWGFASRHPDRVAKLVLLAPDGFATAGRGYDQPSRVPPLLRLLPYTLPDRLLRRSLAGAYADAGTLTEPLYQRYRAMLLAPGTRRAIVDRVAGARRQDPLPQLAKITAPTLLVWGAEDRLIPATHAADYLAALPSARLVTFPGIGHVPQEEAPALTVVPLRDFLRE